MNMTYYFIFLFASSKNNFMILEYRLDKCITIINLKLAQDLQLIILS